MIGIFVKDSLFCPDDYQKTVFDINFEALKQKGIKALLIDLDNTLIPYDETSPNDLIIQLFSKLTLLEFQIVIISNNHYDRVKFFSNQVHSLFVSSARKPLKRGFKKAFNFLHDVTCNQVCVIGDQFMTDVLGGKRMGFNVIVVDAIKRNVEKWYTKLNRKLEKRVLVKLKKHNIAYFNELHLAEKR
ncbi:MAG: YqeG family HAD IIIA-type phosphatase [Firmicutes bacterium]|nr:YqeG family HAD IIIA-type phosphatase [Bacillota bacterium]